MSPVLVADSIGKSFGPRRVLSAASVWVQPGRVTALLGRNGCGKTTLLRIITGTVRPDSGFVRFDGRVHPSPKLHKLACDGLFYIPERDLFSRGRPLYYHFEALRQRFPDRPGGAAARALAAQAIDPFFDRTPEQLSGGERRRAEVALALWRQPKCLLADEPFMGVEPRNADKLSVAIRALAADGAGVLITGHEIELLLAVADDVVWMTSGTTHILGTPADAERHEAFRREYLGPRGLGRGTKPARAFS